MTTTFNRPGHGVPMIDKAPGEALDYIVDWAADPPVGPYLEAGETIASHVVTIDTTGLTVDLVQATETAVIVWLSGGTLRVAYTVTVRIVTSQGRTAERSFTVRVTRR